MHQRPAGSHNSSQKQLHAATLASKADSMMSQQCMGYLSTNNSLKFSETHKGISTRQDVERLTVAGLGKSLVGS